MLAVTDQAEASPVESTAFTLIAYMPLVVHECDPETIVPPDTGVISPDELSLVEPSPQSNVAFTVLPSESGERVV
jgi:hypothetical protein